MTPETSYLRDKLAIEEAHLSFLEGHLAKTQRLVDERNTPNPIAVGVLLSFWMFMAAVAALGVFSFFVSP